MRVVWDHWLPWALLSAVFAALTAIFGKVGVERLDPNFATLIRTVVILAIVTLLVFATGAWQPLSNVTSKSYVFLVLSGLATGASWLCYYRALKLGPASQVAPIDKLSVVFVAILGVIVLGEHLSLKQWFGVSLVTAGALVFALQ